MEQVVQLVWNQCVYIFQIEDATGRKDGSNLDSALLISAPLKLAPGAHARLVDLRSLKWTDSSTGATHDLPPRAAMLRLRLEHAKATIVRIRHLHWIPVSGETPGLAPRPWPVLQSARAIAAHAAGAGAAVPVWRLPLLMPVETMLGLRDYLHAAAPAAIVVSSNDALAHAPVADGVQWHGWLWLLFYVLVVLTLAWVVPRRHAGARTQAWIALLQAATCIAPTLIWAVTLQGHPGPDPAWLIAMSVSFLYALWLAWRSHGRQWNWMIWQERVAWQDWIAPAGTLLAATFLWWLAGSVWQQPDFGHVLAYLAWAGLQQLLILAVILPRLILVLRRHELALLACAVLFALAHTPNALLMQMCLVAELAWAWWYVRRPVLLPVVLAHAASALLLQSALLGLPLRSLEIGSRFLS